MEEPKEESKIVAFSIKPQEQRLIEQLKEVGHYYNQSDMLRSALYALAEKILPSSTLTSVKGEENA